MKSKAILRRIDELIERVPPTGNTEAATRAYEIYMGTVTITAQLYGAHSPQMEELKAEKQRVADSKWVENSKFDVLMHEMKGILGSYKSDVLGGLVAELEDEARAEIYTSLIALAKDCLENGAKDAAAVLTAAALEDALKRYALAHGAQVDEADLSSVINSLKGRSLLRKPEAKIAQSFVTLRNKAMHAEWEKIGKPEIAGAIGFVEHFILCHFGSDNFMEEGGT